MAKKEECPMKKLTIEILREFNESYDYDLPDQELRRILAELRDSNIVSENDILDEFEYYVS
jgi:hypothetical protein